MKEEFANNQSEFTDGSDYVQPKERLDSDAAEFFKLTEEISQSKEIATQTIVKKEDVAAKKKKDKRQKKLLSNMAYAVASVATVAVLTQAAEPDKVVKGSFLDYMRPIQSNVIIFDGAGELTQDDVKEKLQQYEFDGDFSVIIEDGYTEIGRCAFLNCENLVQVELPGSIVEIGDNAFAHCDSLKIEKLSTGNRSIGYNAFEKVYIEEVEIGNGYNPDQNVFYRTQIGKISYEAGLESIPTYTFQNASIESISLPEGVKTIGRDAFWNCQNLIQVEIPGSVTEIDRSAFNECEKLVLHVVAGSYAETYAKEQELNYRIR